MEDTIDVSLELFGVLFLSCGVWWTIQITKVFYNARQRQTNFKSSINFSCCYALRKYPVEGIMKFVYCMAGVIYEIVLATGFGKATALNYRNLLHMTIFAFFAFSCILEIVQHFKFKLIVDNLEYVLWIFAFGAQGLLFGCHNNDDNSIHCVTHNLMQYTSYLCSVSIALEMKFRNNVIFTMFRCVAVTVLGTWFLHVSVIAADAELSIDSDYNTWMVTLYYTWHCAIDGIVVLCIWLITYKCYVHDKCCCIPVEWNDGDGQCLHNRVRFEYPLLNRYDSDIE